VGRGKNQWKKRANRFVGAEGKISRSIEESWPSKTFGGGSGKTGGKQAHKAEGLESLLLWKEGVRHSAGKWGRTSP